MKKETFEYLIESINKVTSKVDVDYLNRSSRYKLYGRIAFLTEVSRIFNSNKMLDLAMEFIDENDYSLNLKTYYKLIMRAINKDITEETLEKFIDEDRQNDYKYLSQMVLNSLNNELYTHCFNGAVYNSVSANGLKNLTLNDDFIKVNSILNKIDLELPASFLIQENKICLSLNPHGRTLGYLEDVPEGIRLFLNSLGVETEDYNTKNITKIKEVVERTLKEIEKSKKLNDEEYSFLENFINKIIEMYCKRINPYMAIMQKETEKYNLDYVKRLMDSKIFKGLAERIIFKEDAIVDVDYIPKEDFVIIEIPLFEKVLTKEIDENIIR